MPTPVNAPYKKAQRKGRAAVRNRGKVLWVSVQVYQDGFMVWMRKQVQGTYIRAIHGKLT